MRYRLIPVLLIGVTRPAAAQCRTPDRDTALLQTYFRRLVVTTDPQKVGVRNRLGLHAMDSTRVVAVTDPQVCARALVGLNEAMGTPARARRIDVVAVGDDYAVRDLSGAPGERRPTIILDRSFRRRTPS